MTKIHKTAIVHPKAKLATSVVVGPYSVIDEQVSIGANTWIGPHAVITGKTTIGSGNKIFQFASVGEQPQDKKYRQENTDLVIGNDNVIREGVTIHKGTIQDKSLTRIGNGNLFMAVVHIAHDCVVGNDNIFANNSAIAGHVKIDDHVIISGFCGVHQFCHIGSYSFISRASLVVKDVPPYLMITGGREVAVCGLNAEGLKRHGFSPDTLTHLRKAYKVIYREGLLIADAIKKLRDIAVDCPEINNLANFLETSTRGIVR